MSSRVFISTFDDPFANLALESCLLSLRPTEEDWLYLWQNRPCVVLGRFQNPWIECNTSSLVKEGIPLVRRQSGGGTVYHDQGNLCFTFFHSHWSEKKRDNFNFIVNSLKKLDIDIYPNDRNDLICKGADGQHYKISGSAFKQKKDRAFHHGTLLVESDLVALKRYLHPSSKGIVSKAIPSNPSPVANLSDFKVGLTVERVCAELSNNFSSRIEYLDKDFIQKNASFYQKEYQKMSSWKWRYGETPRFTQSLEQDFPWGRLQVELTCYKGLIEKASLKGRLPWEKSLTKAWEKSLQNKEYSPSIIRQSYDALTRSYWFPIG